MTGDEVDRFRQAADGIFESGMHLAPAIIKLMPTVSEAKQEVVTILEAGRETAKEPGLRTFYTEVLDSHERLFSAIVELGGRVGTIPRLASDGAATFRAMSAAVSERLAAIDTTIAAPPDATAVMRNAGHIMRLDHALQRFHAGVAPIPLHSSIVAYIDACAAFLERNPGSHGFRAQSKAALEAIKSDALGTALGIVAPHFGTLLKVVALCSTPQVERDIAELRLSNKGTERSFRLQRIDRDVAGYMAFAGDIIGICTDGIIDAAHSMEKQTALVLEVLGRVPDKP